MLPRLQRSTPALESSSDEALVQRVLDGETELYEVLMRRYNQRLYRIARSVLRDGAEAEDVMQDAYVRAFEKLEQFEGRSRFATWLTRIALYEAMARKRRAARRLTLVEVGTNDPEPTMREVPLPPTSRSSPEQDAIAAELRGALEAAVDALPESLRLAFLMRDVEGMSTAEAAKCLGVSDTALKVRLHRARERLRAELESRFGAVREDLWAFDGERCDRIVERVLERILAL